LARIVSAFAVQVNCLQLGTVAGFLDWFDATYPVTGR
jgi:hypothetical protein